MLELLVDVIIGIIMGILIRLLYESYKHPYPEYIEKIRSLDKRVGDLEQIDKWQTNRVDGCINKINEHAEVIKSIDKYIHKVL